MKDGTRHPRAHRRARLPDGSAPIRTRFLDLPAETWVRHRRWKTKSGMRERVTVHAAPSRDLEPKLRAAGPIA
jgi:hypothetical protein